MLNLIVGKPGAGKSYYMVRRLYNDYILDIARGIVNDGNVVRRIYTNIPLDLVSINKQLHLDGFASVDCSKFITELDAEFFGSSGSVCEWWEKFDNGSLIVIDEVQYYLGTRQGKENEDYLKHWEEYISTHRHRQQDLFLLTQHPDNVQKSVLNMAEGCFHIINIKSKVIPYLQIPIADIDTVREAWGSSQQWIQVRYGIYIGRAFKQESVQPVLLEPKYYRLYHSHFTGSSDRPSLKLNKFTSLLWFAKRHFWHLGLKAVCVYLVVSMLYSLLTGLPSAVLQRAGLKKQNSSAVTIKDKGETKNQPITLPENQIDEIVIYNPSYVVYRSGSVVRLGEVKNGKKLVAVDVVSRSASWLSFASVDVDSGSGGGVGVGRK